MATLVPQVATKAGIVPTFNTTAVAGDVFANDGLTYVHFKNGAVAKTVTIVAATTSTTKPGFGTITLSNQTVTVGENAEKICAFFEPAIYNNASGQVAMTYSSETNLTVAVVKTPERI